MNAAGTSGHERVHIFGIRHHGPGSARSLKAALEELKPDLLLVEGPPEAEELLPLVLDEAMQPPVAMLIYAPDDPCQAAYYPFAEYSPEWQAVRYALRHRVPVRMMDLPQAVQLAYSRAQTVETPPEQTPAPEETLSEPLETDQASQAETIAGVIDPLSLLAEAAGYSESEQWWEHLVEQYRGEPSAIFAAIYEGMTALRDSLPADTQITAVRREAFMRRQLRAALADGYQRIAVVCGAWHTPALLAEDQEARDAALLHQLPSIKVNATWIPWTNARLTRSSGYGAGIDSPGWYSHLWANEELIAERWLIRAARLLREEDLDISPAHVIEAVRLAESLAALRGRPLPGLPELNEAALTIFCFGSPLPLRLIEEKLIVGDVLGHVPASTPMAPLQQDFERETRRLRLPARAEEKLLDLDLRRPLDLERSHLLHRLTLLGVPWGQGSGGVLQAAGRGRGGTFHEIWRLKWLPEFAVQLIEAGQWGNTIAAAAAANVSQAATSAPDLPALTGLVEDVLLAELPDAVERVMNCLRAQAAVAGDIRHLMRALPPLASVLRYGNVRQTDTRMISEVMDGLAARVFIGLPGACSGLDEDAARELFDLLVRFDDALNRLDRESYRTDWSHCLMALADLPNTHPLLAGRACRILRDTGQVTAEEAARRFSLGLSTAIEPAQAAAWIEGFLHGSGQLLVHDEDLLGIIDQWINGLAGVAFVQLLPLLRRTFGAFALPERRSIGECIRRGGFGASGRQPGQPAQAVLNADSPNFDLLRADSVLPLAALLLGIVSLPVQPRNQPNE